MRYGDHQGCVPGNGLFDVKTDQPHLDGAVGDEVDVIDQGVRIHRAYDRFGCSGWHDPSDRVCAGRTVAAKACNENNCSRDIVSRFSRHSVFLHMTARSLDHASIIVRVAPYRGRREPGSSLSGPERADIDTVTLREASPGQHASGFGPSRRCPWACRSIRQAYRPPPFPRTVAVEWVDSEGRCTCANFPSRRR